MNEGDFAETIDNHRRKTVPRAIESAHELGRSKRVRAALPSSC
jgi:hypothetical protein